MSHLNDFSRRQQLQKLSLQHSGFIRYPTLANSLLREQRKLARTIQELDLDQRHSILHMDSEIEFFRKKKQEAVTDEDDNLSIVSEAGSDLTDEEDESQEDNKPKHSKHVDMKYRTRGIPINYTAFGTVKKGFTYRVGEFEEFPKKSSENISNPQPLHRRHQRVEKASIVNLYQHEDRGFRHCKSDEIKKGITMVNKAQGHCLESGDHEADKHRCLKTDRQLSSITSGTNKNCEHCTKEHKSHGTRIDHKICKMECRTHSPNLFPKSSHSRSASLDSIPCHLTLPVSKTPPERHRAFSIQHSNFSTTGQSSLPHRSPSEHSRISLCANPMLFHPRFNNFVGLPEEDYNSFQALRKCRYLRIPQKYLTSEIHSAMES